MSSVKKINVAQTLLVLCVTVLFSGTLAQAQSVT